MKPPTGSLLAWLALLVAAAAPGTAGAAGAGEAEALYRRALRDASRGSIEARRFAVDLLERATLLAPDSVTYQLELARLYFQVGFLGQARRRFERVATLRPELADGHYGQGLVWRRDYLKYLDRRSLRRSIEKFREATRCEPRRPEPWLQLVPLLMEEGRLREAMEAAERSWAADPDHPEGLLAVGHVAYRLGQVERADSAFRVTLNRLPAVVRERYEDIAPVASEQDTAALRRLPAEERETFLRRFWREHDPDLATPENEAQLEYWSRVTQAYFLFFNTRRQAWDQRGEVYVRYGAPQKAEYNPVGVSTRFQMGKYGVFPMNVLVWSYPGLGMTVPMQDRLLSEYYLPPMSLTRSTDPAPDPDSLARRHDALATAGGRGVFPLLPPGARPLDLDALLARFEGEQGPRLLGLLEAPGAPDDSLWAEWVVLDSARTDVARGRRALSPSACDPTRLRVADFAAELPPGEYLAGITVRGGRRGRGVFRAHVSLRPARPALAMSDVVVSCGTPETDLTAGGAPAVRLSANPGGRVGGGDPLTVYFETYHLAAGADGLAHLEFEYTVRSAEPDPRFWLQRLVAPRRPIPEVAATRREDHVGDLRRQFVTVPVQGLPAGRYRLEVRVRDLVAGSEVKGLAEFVHQPQTLGGS